MPHGTRGTIKRREGASRCLMLRRPMRHRQYSGQGRSSGAGGCEFAQDNIAPFRLAATSKRRRPVGPVCESESHGGRPGVAMRDSRQANSVHSVTNCCIAAS